MRIIYLHQYFRTPAMSGGTRSYEMARRLVARGHEVHMITAGDTGLRRGWTETEEAGIRVHWCRVPYSNHMGFRARMIAFARFSWLAARKAASLDGDVIFATSTPLSIALPAIWAARRSHARMVFEVRDLWPEMPIAVGALKNPLTIAAARRLERMAYRNAAHVVALSPGMKAGIVSTGYPEHQVSVIPNSCDVELFDVDAEEGRRFRREHTWLGDRPLVVYAGSLGFLNGVDYLARLAAVVGQRDPEIRFLVVGSGKQEESIRRAARSLGVLDRTFFMLPSVPKAAVPAVYSAADIATSLFLDIPQMGVNSANKFFDALAARRPVAVNHHGWIADLIRQADCGLVLDPTDLLASAERLLRAVRNRRWLAAAGAAAGRLGRERFDRDRLAAQLAAVIENEPLTIPLRQAA